MGVNEIKSTRLQWNCVSKKRAGKICVLPDATHHQILTIIVYIETSECTEPSYVPVKTGYFIPICDTVKSAISCIGLPRNLY
jgi:hypothetical protein